MFRFTTPTHRFKFPAELEVGSLSEILITYSQRGAIKLEKHKADLTVGQNNTVYFRLTQEESAKFVANLTVSIQVRIHCEDGASYASTIHDVEVNPVLHEGVITESDTDSHDEGDG